MDTSGTKDNEEFLVRHSILSVEQDELSDGECRKWRLLKKKELRWLSLMVNCVEVLMCDIKFVG